MNDNDYTITDLGPKVEYAAHEFEVRTTIDGKRAYCRVMLTNRFIRDLNWFAIRKEVLRRAESEFRKFEEQERTALGLALEESMKEVFEIIRARAKAHWR